MAERREVLRGIGPIAPLLLAIVSLCVGTSFAKTLFPVVGSSGITALRIGLSALLLVVIQRPWRWRLGATQRAQLSATGSFSRS